MKIAFLFPGQGTQFAGMGKDLYHEFPEVREVYQRASDILAFDVAALSFGGASRGLTETQNAQIVIVTFSLAVASLLRNEGVAPSLVAGHSLGEYSAIINSAGLSFEEGLKIVRLRGELMESACRSYPGAMAAILSGDFSALESLCKQASSQGAVNIANYNSPSQVVISGEKPAVNWVLERFKGKAGFLQVAGAFHSPLMGQAAKAFAARLPEVPINDLNTPLVTNVSAEVVLTKQEIYHELKEQMLSSVRWIDSMRKMINLGIDTFIEVGPGKVLKGFLLNLDRKLNVISANNVQTILNVLRARKKE